MKKSLIALAFGTLALAFAGFLLFLLFYKRYQARY